MIFACGFGYFAVLYIPGMTETLLSSAMCGIALSCFNATSAYLVSVSVEQETVAKACGIYSIVREIGGLIAPVVFGTMAKAAGEKYSP